MAELSIPDQILMDLGRKVGADVRDRIKMSGSLVNQPHEWLYLAISATGYGLGFAVGAAKVVAEGKGQTPTPDELVDGLWEILRPMALHAAGGGDADFRKILAKVRR